MKKIIIIIPYFGNFPNYFQLFLNSCKYNATINWSIITDNNEEYNYPCNVNVIHSSFTSVQNIIRKKFDFTVSIDEVHKLCEYKPAYAYLFPELVSGYDYWGYGDLDLIYGDLRTFLTEDVLCYNKIFQLGHLTLIENKKEYNEMFMQKINDEYLYKKAFSSPYNFNFDEQFQDNTNINSIFKIYGCTIWQKNFAADIYTKSSNFLIDYGDGRREKKKKAFFLWDNGHLYRYYQDGTSVLKKEYLYIHLQKRKMFVNIKENYIYYKIIPNEFASLEVDISNINKYFSKIKKKNSNLQYFKIRYNNLKIKLRMAQR